MEKRPLKPAEITDSIIDLAVDKSGGSFQKLFILSMLAGVFIAFAAEGSNMAAFNLLSHPGTYGLGRTLAGAVFGTGLMLVMLAGGELFTGNTLILTAVCEKKVRAGTMLRNWAIVYLGNFVGALFIASMIAASGLLYSGEAMLGALTLKVALGKVQLTFLQAIILGIMCNWLVCLAVWLSMGADTMAGKMLAIFFPIWLFIVSGFEHSVANMYYIPVGIMIKRITAFQNLAGLSEQALDSLNWNSFFLNNLIPVTIGNIIGGGIFVGMAYWYIYKKA